MSAAGELQAPAGAAVPQRQGGTQLPGAAATAHQTAVRGSMAGAQLGLDLNEGQPVLAWNESLTKLYAGEPGKRPGLEEYLPTVRARSPRGRCETPRACAPSGVAAPPRPLGGRRERLRRAGWGCTGARRAHEEPPGALRLPNLRRASVRAPQRTPHRRPPPPPATERASPPPARQAAPGVARDAARDGGRGEGCGRAGAGPRRHAQGQAAAARTRPAGARAPPFVALAPRRGNVVAQPLSLGSAAQPAAVG